MPDTDDLPTEFHGPISHSDLWLWLALAGLLVVAVYYVAVTWWGRRRTPPPAVAWTPPAPRPDPRPVHLAELDRIEKAVYEGALSAREGHQRVSHTVRSYVGEVTPVPADRMTLADLRAAGVVPLAQAVELMYPPAFAPSEEGHAADRFPEAVRRARELVGTWT
ncbi:hypothetical protein AB3X52_03080 [Nocardioides sp. DS6]|uniref:DUF4129 domain-containing protein n=1 Tax=Nocardioides eburneus TaxID=3231482 RepID=A0ABV3SVU4_9ACTN